MKLKKNDKVRVTTGKDHGRESTVERVYEKAGKVLVKDVNIYKKHIRKSEQVPQGGVVDLPRPLSIEKVALICPKCGKMTRVGFQLDKNGRKYRICRKCKNKI